MKKAIFLAILICSIKADTTIKISELYGQWYLKPEKNMSIEFMMGAGNRFEFELMPEGKARKKVNNGYYEYIWKMISKDTMMINYKEGEKFSIANFILASKYKNKLKLIDKINNNCFEVFIQDHIKGFMCKSKEKLKNIDKKIEKKKNILEIHDRK